MFSPVIVKHVTQQQLNVHVFYQEMEQMEESWKLEASELMQTVQRLQAENKRLSIELAETEGENSRFSPESKRTVISRLC